MSAILVAICLALTYICSKTTYWIFKVFVGFFWWGLAFYWVQLPASTNQSLQTFLVLLPIGTGIACHFWAFWSASYDKSGKEINGMLRLPFMRTTEQEDAYQKSRYNPSMSERNDGYMDRVINARNGRRRR